ncbi:MAG TPA: Ig-like domain-containing protein, partial [Longimicrobium sp.]
MRAIHRPVLFLAALLAGLAAPAQAQRRTEIPPLHVRPIQTMPDTVVPDSSGLRFRLSPAPLRAPEREAPAPALMLPRADAERILSRLEPLPSVAAAERFAFPAATLPPPRTGRMVLAGFPPPDSAGPERPSTGTARVPLTVVRAAPEGQVERGAEVTVTFSQAMVPLSTVSTVEGREVPVRISPRIAGSWRWLDVRTVVFTPEGRVPFATEYTVSIPAGTRSATGGVLAEEVRWTFRTPELSGIGAWPWGEHVRPDPVFLIHFNQQVSPAALLPFIRLAAGGSVRAVRLASAAEIQRDSIARAFAAQAEPATWIAFRAAQPLPLNTGIDVQVRAGAPSAEGPLRTQPVQGWRFRTYAPLSLGAVACGYGEDDCRPGTPWRLEFNNPLDTAGRHAEWVRVVPALPEMRVTASGNELWITGAAAPNTRYTIHVSRAVRDQFGQTLGRDLTRTLRVGPPAPGFIGFSEPMMVLDASGPRTVSVFTHDIARVRLRMHRVGPEDWPAFRARDPEKFPLPGTPVVDRWLRADPAPGAMTEHVIDADEVLRGETGHVVVSVEPAGERPSALWLQVTGVGVAAFADRDSVLVWATSLRDGTPIPGAEVRMLPTGS